MTPKCCFINLCSHLTRVCIGQVLEVDGVAVGLGRGRVEVHLALDWLGRDAAADGVLRSAEADPGQVVNGGRTRLPDQPLLASWSK